MSKEKLDAIDAELRKHRHTVFNGSDEEADAAHEEIKRLLKDRATVPDPEREAAAAKRDAEFRFRTEATESLVDALAAGSATGIESSFKEAMSKRLLDTIEVERPNVVASLFDDNGVFQKEEFVSEGKSNGAPASCPHCLKKVSGKGVYHNPPKVKIDLGIEQAGFYHAKCYKEKRPDAVVEGKNWPRKAHSIHSDIEDAGYTYQRTKNGFHEYENPDGDHIKHRFPTLNGNHSFTHYGPNGQKVWNSANTSDTYIQQHLKSVKKPSHGSPVDPPVDLRVKDPRMGVRSESVEDGEILSEMAVPWPEKAPQLKNYKKTDNGSNVWLHPDGHRFEKNPQTGELTHYPAGSTKGKPFGPNDDVHPYLMKLHQGFDDKVKQYDAEASRSWGDDMRLRHKMGSLDYAYKKAKKAGTLTPEDHAKMAVDYKAMHRAVMNGQRRGRIAARAKYDAFNSVKEANEHLSADYAKGRPSAGTPGCKGCESDTYNGVCMDCTRARAKHATSRGGCKCGKKKVPGEVKKVGSRSWIPCERCFGQIAQLS